MKPTLAIAMSLLTASISVAQAGGDAAAGKAVFKKCMACHTTDPVNRVGPTLGGIVGRPVATVSDFSYSAAMIEFGKGKVWDEALLSEYLMAPKAMVKGTAMTFAGLRKAQDIENIIAFLKDPTAVP